MRFEGNTIIFKSNPENFYKEREGLKPYTIRRISFWSELKEVEIFYNSFYKAQTLFIEIINPITSESFKRIITDISMFEGLYIFAWKG